MDDGQQLRARVAELEASLARVEGERDEARRQLEALTRALAGAVQRDPVAEREKQRAERKRERDRVYQAERQTARVVRDRASSDDGGGGGDTIIVDTSSSDIGGNIVRDRASEAGEDLPPGSDVERPGAEHPELRRWWLWAQDQRVAAGAAVREPLPKGTGSKSFSAWFSAVAEEVGGEALAVAFQKYTADRSFERKGWPVAIFQQPGVWRQRVPRDLVDAHRAKFLEPARAEPEAAPYLGPYQVASPQQEDDKR